MTTYDSSSQEPSKTTPNTHFLYLALAPWCRTVYTSTALHEWYYVRRQPGANVLNVGKKKTIFQDFHGAGLAASHPVDGKSYTANSRCLRSLPSKYQVKMS